MKRLFGAGLTISWLVSSSVLGAGFQLYTEGSAEALGQGGAISGRDDLTSLAWYNPSARAGAERPAIMAGSALVSIHTDFSSSLSSAYDDSMSEQWRAIPHLYCVLPISGDLSALLAVNAPYGLITEWPGDWAGGIAAIYSDFSAIYTTPSLAYRINDRLSASAGFNVVYADAKLTASRDLTAASLPDFGVRTVQGDDVAYGYTASIHGNLSRDWSAGARFQSRVKVKLDGSVALQKNPVPPNETSFPGRAVIELPSSVSLGLANHSFERLQVGFDIIWTEWSSYDHLTYMFGAGYPLTNPEVNSKRWEDVWSTRLGGEYQLCRDWVVRAGYVWDKSPVPNSTRAPELPGSDRQMAMAGLGWRKDNVSIDLAYSFLWADKAQTGSEVVSRVPGTAGTYDTTTQLIGLSVGYIF